MVREVDFRVATSNGCRDMRACLHHGSAVPWIVVTIKGAQIPQKSNLGARSSTEVWGLSEAMLVHIYAEPP